MSLRWNLGRPKRPAKNHGLKNSDERAGGDRCNMGQSADQSSGQGKWQCWIVALYPAMMNRLRLDLMSEDRGHLIIFNWEN